MKKNVLKFLNCVAVVVICAGCNKQAGITANPKDGIAGITLPSASGNFLVTNNMYYVSAQNGDDVNNDGSSGHPYQTINKAAAMVHPGGTVFIKNEGEYYYVNPGNDNIDTAAVVNISHSGTSGGTITYTAFDINNKPVIHARATDRPGSGGGIGLFNAVYIRASYINFENIIIKGDVNTTTLPNPGSASSLAKYNTNAIAIGGDDNADKTPKYIPTHVTVSGCTVYNVPGGGISAIQSDYITIENNTIYNTSTYTKNATSGISFLCPIDQGANGSQTAPKMIIRNNTCHDNESLISTTDGNGIIVDVNNADRSLNTGRPYNGFTRVENNICYNNGGSGIAITNAHNVNILNNTLYNNALTFSTDGEIGSFQNTCKNLVINNNIMYAKSGGLCNRATTPVDASIVYAFNLYYNGSSTHVVPAVTDSNPRFGDPLFVSKATPNFRLNLSSSPAANAGWGTKPNYSEIDILGNPRPKVAGTGPDIGAYESF